MEGDGEDPMFFPFLSSLALVLSLSLSFLGPPFFSHAAGPNPTSPTPVDEEEDVNENVAGVDADPSHFVALPRGLL